MTKLYKLIRVELGLRGTAVYVEPEEMLRPPPSTKRIVSPGDSLASERKTT